MGTGYKNRGSGAAGLGFKNRGAKLVEGAAYTNRGATDGVNEAFKNRGQAWGSDAYYNRGPNDFASLSVLGLAEFYAPLTSSLILTRGTGDPTYSRATNSWEFDNEGKLVLVPSGAARFGGARMVWNQLTYSEDFGNAIWDKSHCNNSSNEVNSPIGTMTADKITINTATALHLVATLLSISFVSGNTYTVSFYIKQSTGRYVQVTFPGSLFGTGQYANIDVSTQSVAYSTGCTCSIIPISDGWMRVSYTAVAQTTGSGSPPLIIFIDSDSSARAPSFLGNGTDSFYIWGAQLEIVTGQADQTASEYVSVGVLSAPYHGAGVDGVKYFNANKDGSAISASSLLGYHSEGARTNSLMDSRDLTNAAWAATNITPAKTATGIDNAPNSASTLTASAADATILQTLSLAAAARSFSAYVKRRTGTGSVYITRDGGTSWTDITSSLGASWTRVKIENTSVLNPSVGFKIATSGDAIDVDVCQDEAGAFISSPIVTTTAAVTRNTDGLNYTEAANLDSTQGSFCFTCKMDDKSSGAGYEARFCIRNSGTGTDNIVTNYHTPTTTHGLEVKSGGTIYASINDGVANTNLSKKVAGAWASNDVRYVTDEALRGSDTSVTTPLGLDQIQIGLQVTTPSKTYIKNVYVWKSVLTTAQLQQVTA